MRLCDRMQIDQPFLDRQQCSGKLGEPRGELFDASSFEACVVNKNRPSASTHSDK